MKLACTYYMKLTFVLDFLGGNKQQIKKNTQFYNFFSEGLLPYFSVSMYEEVI